MDASRPPEDATRRTLAAVLVAAALCSSSAAGADEIRVMTTRALGAAIQDVVPAFERETGHTILTVYGGSTGAAPDSIPHRLERGEQADVVILAGAALDDLIGQGRVMPGSRVDLARSGIGMVVRSGMPRPDVSTVDALRRALLNATSIAYSTSASGVYVATGLLPRLGIVDALEGKIRIVDGDPIATAVARGDADIGFQQTSELLHAPGVDYLGPLPSDVQNITVFSAGIAVGAASPGAARALIAFLASSAVSVALAKSGLEPVTPR